MHTKHFLTILTLGLGLGLTLGLLLAFSGPPARAADGCNRYVVNPGGADTGSCSSQNLPCRTVQYALAQANPGDRICVADRSGSGFEGPSVYTGTIVVTKSVILDGAWVAGKGMLGWLFLSSACAPQNVVLDAQSAGRVISITGSIAPTIRCFTITGGNAAGLGGDPGGGVDPGGDAGGGICSIGAAPLILNNVISGNYGCQGCSGHSHGGGVYLLDAPATAVISGNLIANNVADDSFIGEGGGIMLRNSDAQIRRNTIQGNRAGRSSSGGGGIAVEGGAPTIANNDILTNVASLDGSGSGGGVFIRGTSAVTVEYNLIQGNRAYSGTTTQLSMGGGIYYVRDSGRAVIRGNTLRRNMAANDGPGRGGGLYARYLQSGDVVSGNTLHNNVASESADGYGGGAYLDTCRATIEQNSFLGNIASLSATGYGGGLYVYKGAGLLQSNTISDNHAVINSGVGLGGGLAITNSVVILQDNWIVANRAAWNGQGGGGGVFAMYGAPQFVRNKVLNNEAGGSSVDVGAGGGFMLWASRPWLEGNVILDNVAAGGTQGRGGGVRLLSCPAFTLTNNIIARNSASAFGSGIAILESIGGIAHNTVAENIGGDGVGVGVGSGSMVGLVNNIIVSQTVGISNIGGSAVVAQYTLFDGNGLNYGSGVTSISEIPGPAGLTANYHLRSGSGAIDRAYPLAAVTTDVDGDPRPLGAGPDVGADEARFVYLPLVLR